MNQGGGPGFGAGNGASGLGGNTIHTAQFGQTASQSLSLSTTHSTTTTLNTSSSPISTSTSASTSNSSSGSLNRVTKDALIGGVIGGCAVIFIFGLLAWYYLRRRRLGNLEKETHDRSIGEPNTNTSLSAVPFANSIPYESLVPPPVFFPTTTTITSTSHLQSNLRRRDRLPTPLALETNAFLPPTYAESQRLASLSDHPSQNPNVVIPPHSPHTYPISSPSISPRSLRAPSPQELYSPLPISPQTISGGNHTHHLSDELHRLHSRTPTMDTIRFPPSIYELEAQPSPSLSSPFSPFDSSTALVQPTPVRRLASQDSLERVVRDNILPSPQSPSFPAFVQRELGFSRVVGDRDRNGEGGKEMKRILRFSDPELRESGALGELEGNAVRWGAGASAGAGGDESNGGGSGVQRNLSQRTTDTVSSVGLEVVSDDELERLGVGSRGRDDEMARRREGDYF